MVHEIYRTTGCFVGVFENEGTLHLSCILPEEFRVRHGKCQGAIWKTTKDQGRIVLSFRKGRLNVYGKIQKKKGERRKFRNLSTNVHWVAERLDSWCHSAVMADPQYRELPWTQQSRRTTDLRIKSRMILRPLIMKMAAEQGITVRLPSEVTDVSPENVGIDRLIGSLTYPVLGEFYERGVDFHRNIPSSVSRFLRGHTLNEVAKRAFGRENKKLVRLLGESFLHYLPDVPDPNQHKTPINLCNFQLAVMAKGYVPVDDLYQILSWKHPDSGKRHAPNGMLLSDKQMRMCRRFIKRFSRDRIMRFLKELHDLRGTRETMLLDTCRMFFDPEVKDQLFGLPMKAKSFREVHDEVARQWRRMERASDNAETKLPVSKKLQELEGQGPGDLQLIVPRTARELSCWGSEMRTCIGSYASRVRSRACVILGFERNGRMLYNIEIGARHGLILQFSTFCNQPPDGADEKMVVDWLLEKEIIKRRPVTPVNDRLQAQGIFYDWLEAPGIFDEDPFPAFA